MKKLIAVLLASALLASMGGVALATEICGTGRVDKDLTVTAIIEPAICLNTDFDSLTLKNARGMDLNPCNEVSAHGEASVGITVKSNKSYRKDVGPRDLVDTSIPATITADRLSLIMDKDTASEVNIKDEWEWDSDELKYWSPEADPFPPTGGHREVLTVDLDVNWGDLPGTYVGLLEVSASQV